MYDPEEIARYNIAQTVRNLINQNTPVEAIRKALRQQLEVLGSKEGIHD